MANCQEQHSDDSKARPGKVGGRDKGNEDVMEARTYVLHVAFKNLILILAQAGHDLPPRQAQHSALSDKTDCSSTHTQLPVERRRR